MCGIAGFIGNGSLATLKHITQKLSHRGPDAEGFWHNAEQGIYLGHKRLSIIDIADGKQPMWTKDNKLGIIFNGEIYNYLELRQILIAKGYQFVTHHSDTEVLLHGYAEWGQELPNKLNGMWAFALYDRSKNIVFCSRDRFGKKPFFYTQQHNTFVFASELNAVVSHPDIQSNLSSLSLKKYFAYGYIPAPRSLYEKIYKLPAGHSLIYKVTENKFTITKYWDFVLEPFTTIPKQPELEWGEQLRELMDKAVQRRLMSDVPLGIFLSGGVDSSAIAAFASKHIDPAKLNTFSIGFTEPDFDESIYAAQVAEFLGTKHYPEILSLEKSKQLLPKIISKLDEPMGDSSLLPTYLLCQHAKRKVTVALGGDGGDELFAGYDPFRALKWANLYSKLIPKPIHQAIQMLFAHLPVSHRNMSLDFKIKRTLRGLNHSPQFWCSIWMATLSPNELAELFQEPIDLEEVYSETIEQWEACQQTNLIDKTLQFYTKLYLQDDILVKTDRASMQVSLEARSPFLDIDLINFARQIPNDYKFRNGQTKYILKKALEPMLPNDIIYRKKKGFGVPIGKWFQQKELTLSTTSFPTLNPDFIKEKLTEHTQGKSDQRAFLWNFWVLNGFKNAS